MSDCIDHGKKNDYVTVRYEGRDDKLHRLVYIEAFGPIPEGHEVHHVCENKRCINVEHLVALSRAEHRAKHKGVRQTKRCKRGHDEWFINTQGRRICRICQRERNKQHMRLVRQSA